LFAGGSHRAVKPARAIDGSLDLTEATTDVRGYPLWDSPNKKPAIWHP